MPIRKHTRIICWCFLVAVIMTGLGGLFSSLLHGYGPQTVQLNTPFHSIEAEDDSQATRPFTQLVKRHVFCQVKKNTNVPFRKSIYSNFSSTALLASNEAPEEGLTGVSYTRPSYYNFLFRYTPF